MLSTLTDVPPRYIVEPLRYKDFHCFVGLPKSYVTSSLGNMLSLTIAKFGIAGLLFRSL